MADASHLRRTKPNVLILYNENPAWPQGDIEWANEMVASMTAGLLEQQYPHKFVKFFDDLSVLDTFDPRAWLVWNWARSWVAAPGPIGSWPTSWSGAASRSPAPPRPPCA